MNVVLRSHRQELPQVCPPPTPAKAPRLSSAHTGTRSSIINILRLQEIISSFDHSKTFASNHLHHPLSSAVR
ncbi:hypothetical protein IHE45_17G091100 [Dioscorea alata]|uniref:Uncharacterized protein n=1 Tax=Dioscorea alata TaxID=55571 RepID=A0ACB7UDT8_DIOAL|nr:hypothetical protein IHE45_17G091100 [Dioscorea alata]